MIDLPSGSSSFQLVHAPSGHLVLPCSHYSEADRQRKTLDEQSVALMQVSSEASVNTARAPGQGPSSS